MASTHAAPIPYTLIDVLSHAAERYPSQELSFVDSSSRDSTVHTRTFSSFNQSVRNVARALLDLNKPFGSIIIVYLTEHEDNMTTIWACLLAGYVPCLQPPLSAQPTHKEAHIVHIMKVIGSCAWLTSEAGAEQVRSLPGLEIHLLSDLKVAAERYCMSWDWVGRTIRPDDEAIFFLTSGSSGFSKVVVHTHRTILAACSAKNIVYHLGPDSHILNWVGLDHVGGTLEMHITALLSGASQVHVHASVVLSDSLRLIRLIDEKSINFTFAPNFFLAKLVRDLGVRTDLFGTFDLSSIKGITSGGEALVSATAKAFVSTLKNLSREPSRLSFVISHAFGMTETCAGCIYNTTDVSVTEPKYEFLDLGSPIPGCEMRIVSPDDGITLCPDGENGELQVRGPMLFIRYYNNVQATESSFVEGGWFRTGDMGVIRYGSLSLSGRIKDTVIVHGVSYSIPELETHLQTVEGVMHSFLAVVSYRPPGQQTEGFIIFYSPTFDFRDQDASTKLGAVQHALRDISVKMVMLPPQYIIPIPFDQMEKTTLGKLSRALLLKGFEQGEFANYISCSEESLRLARGASFVPPMTQTERALALIYANIFNLDIAEISSSDSVFELGGTSIDVIRLKRESENVFGITHIPTLQILKHPVIASLASYIDVLKSKHILGEDYDPVVPLNLTGNRTPIFMIHPGMGDVLIFVNFAKYFHNERPFYALRARGFEPGQPFFTSVKEMVSFYVAAIKRTQPHGPYAVAGYSFGGVVAFEVSKHLEALGDEVKFTGLINILPHIAHRAKAFDWTGCMLLAVSDLLGLVSKQDVNGLTLTLPALSRAEQLEEVCKLSSPGRLLALQLTPEKLGRLIDVCASLVNCLKEYCPNGSVATADVFYAVPFVGTIEHWLNVDLKRWEEFSREEPTYTEVPGHHYTLMDFDHVPEFQRIFKTRLEARGL